MAGCFEECFNTEAQGNSLNLKEEIQARLVAPEIQQQKLIDNTSKILNELQNLKDDMNDTKIKLQSSINDNALIKRKLRYLWRNRII